MLNSILGIFFTILLWEYFAKKSFNKWLGGDQPNRKEIQKLLSWLKKADAVGYLDPGYEIDTKNLRIRFLNILCFYPILSRVEFRERNVYTMVDKKAKLVQTLLLKELKALKEETRIKQETQEAERRNNLTKAIQEAGEGKAKHI